jgi:hypothetical protein
MSQTTDVNLPDLQTAAPETHDAAAEPETKRTAADLEAVFDVAVNVSASRAVKWCWSRIG